MTAFFMPERIVLHALNPGNLQKVVYQELEKITLRGPQQSAFTQESLIECCRKLSSKGALAIVAQRRVLDPDYMAEYTSYYGKQFLDVKRLCSRLHFFKKTVEGDIDALSYIDSAEISDYMGFITLRPVIMSPVGATVLCKSLATGFVRSADHFPVHIVGKEFEVCGTPFMQQDNAVGACAQASIWMSLRTLRKREGDRAHDPAQITDAATRYNVSGRVKPNRQGLTNTQMTEAIRAAGYSPHTIKLNPWLLKADRPKVMPQADVDFAKRTIHPYIESEIPVILIFKKGSDAHAVVAVGHTWLENPAQLIEVDIQTSGVNPIKIAHAISWIPELIVNNDNSGPYMNLPERIQGNKKIGLEDIMLAMPVLPPDIFISGEDAYDIGVTLLGSIYSGFQATFTQQEVEASSKQIVIRLLLAEKRQLRNWAASTDMDKVLKDQLRLMDLPKRVWVFEIHTKSGYGDHSKNNSPTLIGFFLIDPTADAIHNAPMMVYLNSHFPLNIGPGTFSLFDSNGLISDQQKTTDTAPLLPMRH